MDLGASTRRGKVHWCGLGPRGSDIRLDFIRQRSIGVASAAEEQWIKNLQNLQPVETAGFGQYKRRNGPGF